MRTRKYPDQLARTGAKISILESGYFARRNSSCFSIGSLKKTQEGNKLKLIMSASALVLALAGSAQAQLPTDKADVAVHTAKATALASIKSPTGVDFTFFKDRYCKPAVRGEAPAGPNWREMVVPPAKVFDNLYYVGHAQFGSWIVKTSAGLILLDALDSPKEAQDYIEAGMAKLGLDPHDLKYIIIMHGHGDHYGGTRYLQDKYPGLRVAGFALAKRLT